MKKFATSALELALVWALVSGTVSAGGVTGMSVLAVGLIVICFGFEDSITRRVLGRTGRQVRSKRADARNKRLRSAQAARQS